MTKSELLKTAHKIASFKDAEKVGNKIFRSFGSVIYDTYRKRLSKAMKYLYKLNKNGEYFTAKRSKVNADSPTIRQWGFLQRNRVDAGDNYSDFLNRHTKKSASKLISEVIAHKEDGYSFSYGTV
jgi:hypothetical protein